MFYIMFLRQRKNKQMIILIYLIQLIYCTNTDLNKEKVVPIRYDLNLNIRELDFDGIVNIKVEAFEAIDSITLDSKVTTKLVKINGKESKFSENDDKLVIDTKVKNQFEIEIEFNGKIGTALKGIYRAKELIVTQFEPTEARRMFPCFDIPDKKAYFKFIIQTNSDYIVLSNTPVIKIKKSGDLKTTYFAETPKMSTYLLALAIGKMVALEFFDNQIKKLSFKDLLDEEPMPENSQTKLRMRIYKEYNEKNEIYHDDMRFGLSIAQGCLEYFEKYFQIPFPLKKLDLIGVPNFAAGAMENWGLITFRESSLFGTEKSTPNSLRLITETICHELAHQWHGNLVTMKWWNDLWLNESFASWAASKAVTEIKFRLIKEISGTLQFTDNFFDVDLMADFVLNGEQGLEFDSLRTTQAIVSDVKTDNEVEQIETDIIYNKGMCLIRMLENYMSPEKFKAGVTKYIKNFAYSNSTTADLFSLLNDQKPGVKELMDNWLNMVGYPLITLQNDFSISQGKFLTLQNDSPNKELPNKSAEASIVMEIKNDTNIKDKAVQKVFTKIILEDLKNKINLNEDSNPHWIIPIKIDWLDGNQEYVLLKDKTTSLEKKSNLFKLNSEVFGFYRVKYENVDWNFQLLRANLDPKDKIGIINDINAITLACEYKVDVSIKACFMVLDQTNFELISDAISTINMYKYLLPNHRKFFEEKLGNVLKKQTNIQVPPNNNDKLLKLFYLKEAAKLGLNEANFLENDNIPELYKPAQYIYKITVLDENLVFDDLLSIYKDNPNPDQRMAALKALTFIKSQSKMIKLIEMIGNEIKMQDSIYIFGSLASNLNVQTYLIEYVLDNWESILKKIGENTQILGSIVKNTFKFTPENLYDRTKHFLESLKIPKIERAISHVLEVLEIRKRFRNYNQDFNPESLGI